MAKLLGVDYGTRRIGIAVGDTETRVAMPLMTVKGADDAARDARMIADLGAKEKAEAFVVGLPLNMTAEVSTDSAQTILTRRFAAELERCSGKPVRLQDERLTSFAAEEVLEEAGFSRKKRKGLSDRIAAQKILQGYFDQA
jgi:putative Holliday junction resolvase